MTGRGPNKQQPYELSVEEFLSKLDSLAGDRLFSEQHAAVMLGKSVKTLQEERRVYARTRERNAAAAEMLKSKQVPWIMVGANSIRYRLGDLRDWIQRQRFGGIAADFDPDAYDIDEGVGIMLTRLSDGRLPFAIKDGKILDFIDSSNEDIDSVETMFKEEAFVIETAGFKIAT